MRIKSHFGTLQKGARSLPESIWKKENPSREQHGPYQAFSIFTGCVQDSGELLSDPEAEGPAAV